jgi:hypothetical protein
MHTRLQSETFNSLKTSLYFAIKGEESLWMASVESTKDVPADLHEYDPTVAQWRTQVEVCVSIAKLIQDVDPDYTDYRFEATFGSKRIFCLKPFLERKSAGLLIHKIS